MAPAADGVGGREEAEIRLISREFPVLFVSPVWVNQSPQVLGRWSQRHEAALIRADEEAGAEVLLLQESAAKLRSLTGRRIRETSGKQAGS